MSAGSHQDGGKAAPPRLLVDCWEEGGDRHLLVVAQGATGSVLTLVVHSPAQHFWEGATARVDAFPDAYDRAAVLREVPTRALGRTDLAALGLFGSRGSIVEDIARHMAKPAPLVTDRDMLRMGPGSGKTAVMARMVERMRDEGVVPAMIAAGGRDPAMRGDFLEMHMRDLVEGVQHVGRFNQEQMAGRLDRQVVPSHVAARHHGFEPGMGTPVLVVEAARGLAGQIPAGYARPHTVLDFSGYSRRQANDMIEGALRAQAPFISGPEDAAALAALGRTHWTERAHGFLSRGGRVGERRRQAARLYPAFAVTLSSDRDACAAIDAGRPFEEALLENLRPMASPGTRDGLTLAALRRLRALPADTDFRDVVNAVEIAAQMPVDWLPKGTAGWSAAIEAARPLMAPCRSLGIRLDELSHHVMGDLTLLEGSVPDPKPEAEVREELRLHGLGVRMTRVTVPHVAALQGARDMASRLADTLVSHACQSMGVVAPREELRRIAGAILFGGKAMPAVARLQKDWHAGIPRLDAALPAHEAGNAWPAAFEPYVAGNGLAVVCLTDEAQLKAEGTRGPDADGIQGLPHLLWNLRTERRGHQSWLNLAESSRPAALPGRAAPPDRWSRGRSRPAPGAACRPRARS